MLRAIAQYTPHKLLISKDLFPIARIGHGKDNVAILPRTLPSPVVLELNA